MEIFSQIISFFAALPDWVPLILLPALLPCGALLFAALRRRRFYLYYAIGVGALGFAVMSCKQYALAYLGLTAPLAALFALLLLIPFPKRGAKRLNRDERIYRKFHEDLQGTPPPRSEAPPKVCCFEEAPAVPAEESGVRLSHVRSLIERLKKEKLSAADRLEVDALSRSVDGCMGRALGREELGFLNDCLASVLKLTAKYKL